MIAAHSGRARDSLEIRAARGDDVADVVALVESAYRGDASRAGWTTEADLLGGQRTDAAAVASLLAQAGSEILLAVQGGVLVGCCHLAPHAVGCYFGMFAVRPGSQGRGVGQQLLAAAEARAAARGARTMRMTVIAQRVELIAWYERRGYRPTGEREPFPYGDERFGLPRRDDLEFVVLEKPLATS